MKLRRKWIVYLLFFVAVSFPSLAAACTLWAGAGERVAGGGTLIAKNRDWRPDHQQQLRLFRGTVYRYLTLYAVGNDAQGSKAGVNEKGLVIVSASAPPHLDRKELFAGRTSLSTLLGRYESVAAAIEALQTGQWTCGPEFLLLADRREVACVEFGLSGSYAITGRTASGALYHTNHYLAEELTALNAGSQTSSHARYEKIRGYLEEGTVLNAAACRAFSSDPVLWRSGTTPASTRTMAGWIISQTPQGEAVLYLKMANPGKSVREYELKLAEVFAGRLDISSIE